MRVKDEIKQLALFEATVKVVNEIGFASSSVSKIAKLAGVSPATLYIYYENKEDLIVSTYVEIKKRYSSALLADFDESRPIRDILKCIWLNGFRYVSEHRPYFAFAEQFANSPYSEKVDKAKVESFFEPMRRVVDRGIEQKIIKDVSFDLLSVFIIYPITIILNKKHCSTVKMTEENIELAFDMAWDAIRL